MKKLIAVLVLMPMFCFAVEDTADTSGKACSEAIDAAERKVRDQANYINNQIQTSSEGLEPDAQVMTTGNPVTDMAMQMAQLNMEAAKVNQQRVDALGQVEDNCFQQNEQISDNENKSLISDIRRQRDITDAEANRIRQDAGIKAACAKEAADNFQAELTRLQSYQARIVSNVGAATRGKAELRRLQDQFYNRCWNSQATQIALDGNRQALELKMRNFMTEQQAVIAEREYINTKRAHLNGYCGLQIDRVDEKNRMAANAIKQQQQMAQIGMGIALFTSQNAAAAQGAARNNFSSLDQLLNANNWKKLKEGCMNMHSDTTTIPFTDAPSDVAPYFDDVNTACRPSGASANTKCVISSGQQSAERRRQRSAASNTKTAN